MTTLLSSDRMRKSRWSFLQRLITCVRERVAVPAPQNTQPVSFKRPQAFPVPGSSQIIYLSAAIELSFWRFLVQSGALLFSMNVKSLPQQFIIDALFAAGRKGGANSDRACLLMAARGFRHLPVLDAGKVVGVISIGDVVKDIIRNLEHNVGDLAGYIMTDGPGGLTDEPRRRRRRCCRCPFRVIHAISRRPRHFRFAPVTDQKQALSDRPLAAVAMPDFLVALGGRPDMTPAS